MVRLPPSFNPRPRRSPRGLALRFTFAALLVFSFYGYFSLKNPFATHIHLAGTLEADGLAEPAGNARFQSPSSRHPIDDLVEVAEKDFSDLLSRQSDTVEAAANAYRARRGRHPPPGFDTWFKFAQNLKGVVVEDFFDQIYHDLEPFWALDTAYLRKEAASFDMLITVRDGVASATSDWFWTKIWLDLIQTIDHMLPDMDIAVNPMDEPRIVVPHEDIAGFIKTAAKFRVMKSPERVLGDFQRLPPRDRVGPSVRERRKTWQETGNFWELARRGCPADSLARTTPLQKPLIKAPDISMKNAAPHLYRGFVANSTLAKDICHQPDLQGLNGVFIEPLSTSTTNVLFPLFGGSKLGVNNEILLPSPMNWNNEERFTAGDNHGGAWADKGSGLVWRGVATGGRNRPATWKGFHRHRFVAMANATELSGVDRGWWPPRNFAGPDLAYNIKAKIEGKLGEWVGSWANVAFTDLFCEPDSKAPCAYVAPYYSVALGIEMAQQFLWKYLPDIDGNSFSGRYLGFLRSTSMPIKATIWREWHDSRLVAWKHFVPMDSRFGDFYGIMQYFLGYGSDGVAVAHDAQAERIATAGKEWAERVLRKEDMQIYTLRLLLEYGRVMDARREEMGWVDDLLGKAEAESDAKL